MSIIQYDLFDISIHKFIDNNSLNSDNSAKSNIYLNKANDLFDHDPDEAFILCNKSIR